LRNLWLKSPDRTEAKTLSRKSRGKYQCSNCCQLFKTTEVHVHHIHPMGTFTTWDDFIEKLFCPSNELTVVCKNCHKEIHR
jgi:hypothetical protein